MALDVDQRHELPAEWQPGADFVDRLASSLEHADREKRRRSLLRRLRAAIPAALLLGTLFAWHLTFTGANGVHLVVDTLTWLALILDVGVHLDSTLLAYLGMPALPTVVGMLLFVLVTVTLLWEEKAPE